MPRSVKVSSRGLAGAGLALAVAGAALLLQTSRAVQDGFDTALSTRASGLSFATTKAPKLGDEGFWLTRGDVQSPFALAKPMAIGDRITISAADGQERKLEVIDVTAVGGQHGATGLVLVTCRVTDAGGHEVAPIRFVVEGEAPKLTAATQPKAL